MLAFSDASLFRFNLSNLKLKGSYYQVYEGESLIVCVAAANSVPTELTVTVKGLSAPNNMASAIGIILCCLEEHNNTNFCMVYIMVLWNWHIIIL